MASRPIASERFDLPPDADMSRFPYADHPVLVPVDPSGEQALFVSESQTSHIADVSSLESETILRGLFDVLYAPSNTFVHRWSTGDVIVWNNIALQHGRPERVGSAPRDFWRLKSAHPVNDSAGPTCIPLRTPSDETIRSVHSA